jgi:pilus assembly protein TadC
MKYFLSITFLIILGVAIFGFSVRQGDPKTGEFCIGISIAVLFFLWMPFFIYHRWKNRSMKDYMLTKENIDKMRKEGRRKKL